MRSETNSICREIKFLSRGLLLRGVLHLPHISRPPVVIGSHGLFGSGDSPKQIALAEECSRHGIAFFRFDHSGCGRSQGTFTDVTSIEGRCDDIINAIKMLWARGDTGNRTGLFGSSMGGAVCMAVAAMPPYAGLPLVTAAAPVRILSNPQAIDAIQKSGDAMPDPAFYRKNLQFDISDKIPKISNILIFHGDADEVIPFSHGLEIYENAGDPKRLIVQKGGDHRMTRTTHQEIFIREAGLQFIKNLL